MRRMKLACEFRSIALISASLALIGCAAGSSEVSGEAQIMVPDGEPVSIAILQSFSTRASSPYFEASVIGLEQQRAVEMAVDLREEVAGHPIEVAFFEDEFCNEEGGSAGATRIVGDPSVVGVIGTTCSEAAFTASPIITDAGRVLISGSNTSPLLTSMAGRAEGHHHAGYYRTVMSDAIQGVAGAHYAFEALGARSAVLLIDDDESFSQPVAAAFEEAFEGLGGTVVGSLTVTPTADFESEVGILEAKEPDLFYLSFEGEIAPAPVLSWLTRLAGLSPSARPTVMGWERVTAGRTVEQTKGIYWTGPGDSDQGDLYDQFLDSYRRRYGEASRTPYSDNAYDATNILLDAIEFASIDTDGDLVIDLALLREGLAVTDRVGVNGRLRCDEFGDCAAPGSVPIFQVNSGSPADDFLEHWTPPEG